MATLIGYRLSEKKGSIVQIAILSMELLFLSTGLVSTLFMLKQALSPRYLFDMFFLNLREFLNSLLSSPLCICLCIFINSVAILFLSVSKFHHHPTLDYINSEKDPPVEYSQSPPAPEPDHHVIKEDMLPKRTNSAIAVDTIMSFFSRYNDSHPILEDGIHDEMPSMKDIEMDCVHIPSAPHISLLTDYQGDQMINQENSKQPPPDEGDSFEATWEAITGGGKKKDKKKKLKKSETEPMKVASAQSIGSKDLLPSAAAAWKELRKSVTFNESLSMFRRGGLRGDFSVSTEESDKRFDDFINKNNRERMLQRQQSEDQRAALLMNNLTP